MTAVSLVDRLFSRYTSGLPLLPISGGDGTGDDRKDPPQLREEPPDLGKLVEAAVARHGDGTSAMKAIISDLYSARDDNKALRSEVKALRGEKDAVAAKVPTDGSLVLVGDDAKAWDAYKTLGKPADIVKLTSDHKEVSAENAALKRQEELRTVAEKTGTRLAVLRTLAGDLVFAPGKGKAKDGKEIDIMTIQDGDKPPVPFADYAAAHWGDFKESLHVKPLTTSERPNPTPSRTDPTGQILYDGDGRRVFPSARNQENGEPPKRIAVDDIEGRLFAQARGSF